MAIITAGSQLILVPARQTAAGDHLTYDARLMVVPVGVPLPPGVMRLAASPGSRATPRSGLLRSPSMACVSTASARRGLLRASAVGGASTFVPASGAAPRSIYCAFREPEPALLAPNPLASRRSKTVAYAAHGSAPGAADETNSSESRDNDAKDGGAYDSTKENPKDDGGAYDSTKENPKDDDGGAAASKENRVVYKDNGGAGSVKEHRKDSNGAGSAKESAKEEGADVSMMSNPKDDGHAGSAKASDEEVADGGADTSERANAYENDAGADPKKKDHVDFDLSLPPSLLKALESLDSKDNGDGAKDDAKQGSKASNDDDDLTDGVADGGTLQGRVDPRMIIAELDLFALDYNPTENFFDVSVISYDRRVLAELQDAMRSCTVLLNRAMERRPPLAEHSKELFLIGRSFRVVAMEVQRGFVQSRSVLMALEGLKSMGNLFLGPYVGFLKPLPTRQFPFKPPAGTGEKLYFSMLVDYYFTVLDCVRTEIFAIFAMDGQENNLEGFD